MIIDNGFIEFIEHHSGGVDTATGYPVADSEEAAEPIPCQFSARSYNGIARQGQGEPYTQQSYTILIEQRPLKRYDKLRLTGYATGILGEFAIISTEPLDAVCQIKITV
jgi:hypothetical protein